MESEFKIGDKVYLFDATNCYTAELNKTYTIIDIKNDTWNRCSKLAFQENTSYDDELCYLDSRRFKKDIKFIRRNKLKEIFKNDK